MCTLHGHNILNGVSIATKQHIYWVLLEQQQKWMFTNETENSLYAADVAPRLCRFIQVLV